MRQMDNRGYAMAALLVAISVMAVFLSAAMPSWYTMAKREREAELVFRGQQYARAVTLFQRKFAGAYPPNLDILLSQKFLRKQYKDPMTNGDFQLVPVGDAAGLQAQASATPGGPAGSATPAGRGGPAAAGQAGGARGAGAPAAGIQGVVSKSSEASLRVYNGRTRYNEWVFIAVAASTAAGAPAGAGAQSPGVPGGVQGGGQGGQGRGGPGGGVPQDGRGRQGGRGGPAPGGLPGFPPGAPPPGGGQAPGFPFPGGAGRGRF